MSLPDVSIIIVSYKSCDMVQQCIESVYAKTRDLNFEIVVVDNHSGDGTVEMVQRQFPEAKVIPNADNVGFARACNQGIELVPARYYLLLNPDTILQRNSIYESMKHMDERKDIGVLGCLARYPDGTRQNTCIRFPSVLNVVLETLLTGEVFPDHPFFNRYRYGGTDFNQEQDVDVVAGCFYMMRKEAVDQVGAFDRDFFLFGEEMEWCYRSRRAGWKTIYWPGTEIIHAHGATYKKGWDPLKQLKRRSHLMVLNKTHGTLSAYIANVVMTLGVLIRVPLWLLVGLVRAYRSDSKMQVVAARCRIAWFHVSGLFWPVWR